MQLISKLSKKHRVFAVLLLLGFVVGGVLVLTKKTAKPVALTSAPKAALTVSTTQLAVAHWARTLAANGSVLAWQEAIIGAELSGVRIADVKVNVGDQVRRGEVLATLVADTQQATEAEAKAAMLEAEAVFAEAQAAADRARKLRASGFVSEQQVVQATTAERSAGARLEVQRARHLSNALRLAQTRILAPDDGRISASVATVGTLTQPGAELFRLIRKGRLEWRAELTADELAQVSPGMSVDLLLPQGRVVSGKVRAVSPAVSNSTRYGLVLVDLPEAAHLISGLFARGVIKLGEDRTDVQTLPQSALVQREGASLVLVVTPERKVQERKVVVGQRLDDRVEIISGLALDVAVVESGGAFLTDGDVVRLLETKK